MKFLQGEEFTISLRDLFQKGGRFQRAAQTVQSIWGRAKLEGASLQETFHGVPCTNYGESRIPHCVKYDLTGYARLVTVVHDNICLFLFTGDHTAVDKWLERNKGLDFLARRKDGAVVLDKVRVSDVRRGSAGRINSESDLSVGPLLELLSERYRNKVLANLDAAVLAKAYEVDSLTDDDDILEICTECAEQAQQAALMDVFLSLRSGDVVNAKSVIDLYAHAVQSVEVLPEEAVESIQSSDTAVLLSDIDSELFAHFVETASFEKWMLYLHPSQRQHVERNFKGPARMAGVSGSGKTCVVIHRALRLADSYPSEKILIVTLSAALAALIDQLIDAQRGENRPANLRVTSIFDLCYEKLMQLEPHRRDYYTKRSIAKNAFATSEHFDDVWTEFFMCENNNNDASVLLEATQLLNARGIYANDYLRQEFDYIRSTYAPHERSGYLTMDRQGRIVPLEERFRLQILDGLAGWERKMDAVGVIDDMGIVAALYKHLDKLVPEYRAILVDEAQDLGTLELAVLRKLAVEAENDLFLCADAAQTIYTKSADLKLAGIDTSGRAVRLNQNYRNSRQILTAAHSVLQTSLDSMPKGAMDLEVLAPEFASFSSPKPLLLRAPSFKEELEYALGYLNACLKEYPTNHRFCLAVCGYGQAAIEQLGEQFKVEVLAANTDVRKARIFISDLEQTKGFEFDAVVVINCSAAVLPHPNLPIEESFRDLCRLYVALTRAKTQLVVSYSGEMSSFVSAARIHFVEAEFQEYADKQSIENLKLPKQTLPSLFNQDTWSLPGRFFLKSRDAVGLDRVVQDEIIAHVTGIERRLERKQLEWKTFGLFAKSMEDARSRHQIISEEAWANLSSHLSNIRQQQLI